MSLECYLAILRALERARTVPSYAGDQPGIWSALEAIYSTMTDAEKLRMRSLVIGSGNGHLLNWSY